MVKVLLRFSLLVIAGISAFGLSSCGSGRDTRNKMIVSVRDQRMMLTRDGKPVKVYPVSTSKFGVGDIPGTNRTPLGRMEVAKKIGEIGTAAEEKAAVEQMGRNRDLLSSLRYLLDVK